MSRSEDGDEKEGRFPVMRDLLSPLRDASSDVEASPTEDDKSTSMADLEAADPDNSSSDDDLL
jgi:hypothetical protein